MWCGCKHECGWGWVTAAVVVANTNAAVPTTTTAGSACGLVIRVVTDTACGTGGARPSSTRLRRFARG